jgi:hypothetical protein
MFQQIKMNQALAEAEVARIIEVIDMLLLEMQQTDESLD